MIVLWWLGIKIRNQIRIEQCRFKFSIKTSWFQVVQILPRLVIQKDGYFSVRLTVKPRAPISIKEISNAHPYPNILWEWSLIISNWSSQVLGITLIVTDIHWNQTPLFICSLIIVFIKDGGPVCTIFITIIFSTLYLAARRKKLSYSTCSLNSMDGSSLSPWASLKACQWSET